LSTFISTQTRESDLEEKKHAGREFEYLSPPQYKQRKKKKKGGNPSQKEKRDAHFNYTKEAFHGDEKKLFICAPWGSRKKRRGKKV